MTDPSTHPPDPEDLGAETPGPFALSLRLLTILRIPPQDHTNRFMARDALVQMWQVGYEAGVTAARHTIEAVARLVPAAPRTDQLPLQAEETRPPDLRQTMQGLIAQDPEWTTHALQALERLARRQRELTADDVAAAGVPEPRHPGAWGSLLWLGASRGIIKQTNLSTPSRRPSSKGSRISVWQSRVYEQDQADAP